MMRTKSSITLIYIITSWHFFNMDAAGKQRAWIGPSKFITGAPSPRDAMGFSPSGGKLYVFGGKGATGSRHHKRIVANLRLA